MARTLLTSGVFGIERLMAALRDSAGGTADQILQKIDAAKRTFAAGSDQPDDMTAIVVKRLLMPGGDSPARQAASNSSPVRPDQRSLR